MSWLSDLADRAETLLNKIDQNAAAVLQEKDKKILLSNNEIVIEKKNESSTYVDVNQVTTSPKNKLKISKKLAKIDKKLKNNLQVNEDRIIDESSINIDDSLQSINVSIQNGNEPISYHLIIKLDLKLPKIFINSIKFIFYRHYVFND